MNVFKKNTKNVSTHNAHLTFSLIRPSISTKRKTKFFFTEIDFELELFNILSSSIDISLDKLNKYLPKHLGIQTTIFDILENHSYQKTKTFKSSKQQTLITYYVPVRYYVLSHNSNATQLSTIPISIPIDDPSYIEKYDTTKSHTSTMFVIYNVTIDHVSKYFTKLKFLEKSKNPKQKKNSYLDDNIKNDVSDITSRPNKNSIIYKIYNLNNIDNYNDSV